MERCFGYDMFQNVISNFTKNSIEFPLVSHSSSIHSFGAQNPGLTFLHIALDAIAYKLMKIIFPTRLNNSKDQNPSRAWAWTFWELEVPVPNDAVAKGNMEICCRATDASYCVQPESPEPIWNIRGLNNVSWHRVQLPVVHEVEE